MRWGFVSWNSWFLLGEFWVSLKVGLTPAASVSCPLSTISEEVGWAHAYLALVPVSKTICTVDMTSQPRVLGICLPA